MIGIGGSENWFGALQMMNEQFGGYALLERIGVGGMAEVFLARRTGVAGFERDIAIKRIRPHLSEHRDFINMFLGEAKLAAQLTHSNIVQIYDLGRIQDSYFIAMEYVAGRDMSALMPKTTERNIPFPFEYALKIASQVCEGLHYAHSLTDQYGNPLHIVHRDVSPENIRISWTGAVKILDFGIAKAVTQVHETKAGEIKGKLSYMSPEQVLGKEIDARSDVFALGCVLYEALTGQKLHTGSNDLDVMNKIVESHVYPPRYFRDDIPEGAEAIIMKALEKDRRKRFQTARDMQMAIDDFLSEHEFSPSNVHLANFLKQQFEDELQKEQQKRRSGASSSAAHQGKTPPPPPAISGMHQQVTPAAVRHSRSDPNTVKVRLTTADVAALKRIADSRGLQPEDIARDILQNFLKYHP